MTQEDKTLLLKDLCARLPYGVIVQYKGHYTIIKNKLLTGSDLDCNMECCKPYLRPMSSMTEEEYLKYSETREWKYVDDDHYEYFDTLETFDWLNEHHFDFRNLIGKGLAIDCTDLNIY